MKVLVGLAQGTVFILTKVAQGVLFGGKVAMQGLNKVKGDNYYTEGKYKDAINNYIKDYIKAINSKAANRDIIIKEKGQDLIKVIDELESLDQFGDVISEFEKVRNKELNTYQAKAFVRWGDSLLENGECEDAIKKYDEAIKLDSANKVQFEVYKAGALVKWGDFLFIKGNYEYAITQYDEAIKLDSANKAQFKVYKARALVKWGDFLFGKGNYEDAITQYDKAIKLDSANKVQFKVYKAGALVKWGDSLLENGECEDAIKKYDEAIKLDSADNKKFTDKQNEALYCYVKNLRDDKFNEFNKLIQVLNIIYTKETYVYIANKLAQDAQELINIAYNLFIVEHQHEEGQACFNIIKKAYEDAHKFCRNIPDIGYEIRAVNLCIEGNITFVKQEYSQAIKKYEEASSKSKCDDNKKLYKKFVDSVINHVEKQDNIKMLKESADIFKGQATKLLENKKYQEAKDEFIQVRNKYQAVLDISLNSDTQRNYTKLISDVKSEIEAINLNMAADELIRKGQELLIKYSKHEGALQKFIEAKYKYNEASGKSEYHKSVYQKKGRNIEHQENALSICIQANKAFVKQEYSQAINKYDEALSTTFNAEQQTLYKAEKLHVQGVVLTITDPTKAIETINAAIAITINEYQKAKFNNSKAEVIFIQTKKLSFNNDEEWKAKLNKYDEAVKLTTHKKNEYKAFIKNELKQELSKIYRENKDISNKDELYKKFKSAKNKYKEAFKRDYIEKTDIDIIKILDKLYTRLLTDRLDALPKLVGKNTEQIDISDKQKYIASIEKLLKSYNHWKEYSYKFFDDSNKESIVTFDERLEPYKICYYNIKDSELYRLENFLDEAIRQKGIKGNIKHKYDSASIEFIDYTFNTQLRLKESDSAKNKEKRAPKNISEKITSFVDIYFELVTNKYKLELEKATEIGIKLAKQEFIDENDQKIIIDEINERYALEIQGMSEAIDSSDENEQLPKNNLGDVAQQKQQTKTTELALSAAHSNDVGGSASSDMHLANLDEPFPDAHIQIKRTKLLSALKGKGEDKSNDFGYPKFFDEYYSEGINQILQLRIDSENFNKTKVYALKADYYLNDYTTSATEIACEVKKLITDGCHTILVPYNINNQHWVGIVFEKNIDNIDVTYIDPQNNQPPSALLTELMPKFAKASFKQIDVEEQKAGNCGPEIIEDFMEYVFGSRIPQELAVMEHSKLVEQDILGAIDQPLDVAY